MRRWDVEVHKHAFCFTIFANNSVIHSAFADNSVIYAVGNSATCSAYTAWSILLYDATHFAYYYDPFCQL